MKCNICGKEITGFGNNAWPVRTEGECCNDCNFTYIIPARLTCSRRSEEQIAEFANMLNTKTKDQLDILFDID